MRGGVGQEAKEGHLCLCMQLRAAVISIVASGGVISSTTPHSVKEQNRRRTVVSMSQ